MTERDLKKRRDEGDSGFKDHYDQSWAVIVGINDYVHHSKLEFAVADAVGVAHALANTCMFPAANMFLVLDGALAEDHPLAPWLDETRPMFRCLESRATKATIERVLLTELPECATTDDRICVFYAGHGHPREKRGSGGKLLEPYLVPAEAGREAWHEYIDLKHLVANGEYLPAKHVFYIFDSCCSGLVGLRSGGPGRFKKDLLRNRARQCLTSGTAVQKVADAGRNGHSIFTSHLIELLQDGVVGRNTPLSASALSARLKERVGTDGRSLQTPSEFTVDGDGGGDFLFEPSHVPLSEDERTSLSRILMDDIALPTNEVTPMELASALWGRSIDEQKVHQAKWDALRERARIELARGNYDDAVRLLEAPVRAGDCGAKFLAGLACLGQLDLEGADAVFDEIALADPDTYGGWRGVGRSTTAGRGRRVAVLIGATTLADREAGISGCSRDAKSFAKVVSQPPFSFDVVEMLDSDATTAGINDVLGRCARELTTADAFLCYIAGSGLIKDDVVTYPSWDRTTDASITERELLGRLSAIQASKLLITDGCHLSPNPDEAPKGLAWLFGGTREGATFETRAPDDSIRGAFTLALEQTLGVLGNASLRSILEGVRTRLGRSMVRQEPGLAGDASILFVDDVPVSSAIVALAVGAMRSLSDADLARAAAWVGRRPVTTSLSDLRLNLGREQMRRGNFIAADDSLTTVDTPKARLPRLEVLLRRGHFKKAAELFETTGTTDDDETLKRQLKEVAEVPRRALLVLTCDEDDTKHQLRHELSEMLLALKERCAVSSGQKLVNPRRSALARHLERLDQVHPGDPTLFFFVGPGFATSDDVWLATDENVDVGGDEMLRLSTLRRPGSHAGLTSVVLLTRRIVPRDLETGTAAQAPFGRAMFVVGGVHRDIVRPRVPLDTVRFIKECSRRLQPGFTFGELRSVSQLPGVMTGDPDQPLLGHKHELQTVFSSLQSPTQRRLDKARGLLDKLARDPDVATTALLNAAVVEGERSNFAGALDLIRRARTSAIGLDAHRDATLRYHEGRMLYRLSRFTEAETAFVETLALDPDHARAHYYRARAIQGLINTDLPRLENESIAAYSRLGAPFGAVD